MTADLAEEHSTATLATERLEAEQADRLKLEKEKADLQVNKLISIMPYSLAKMLTDAF